MTIPSDIPLKTIDGEAKTLGAFDGKALLIGNVASKCGFAPQYEGLEALHPRLGVSFARQGHGQLCPTDFLERRQVVQNQLPQHIWRDALVIVTDHVSDARDLPPWDL